MTLPIIDSMLRGDLRKRILTTLISEKQVSLLWRDLYKTVSNSAVDLITLEKALIAAVETNGFVNISTVYNSDREMRRAAEDAKKNGLCFGEEEYTSVGDRIIHLDGIFDFVPEKTPTDKFLHLLVKAECARTLKCFVSNSVSIKDDAVMRTDIRKLFSLITSLCKDSNDSFIQENLTQLYFEVYHTFSIILEHGKTKNYETDFENFIFGWKGEFPDECIVESFKKRTSTMSKQPSDQYQNHEQNNSLIPITPPRGKDKYDKFLDMVNVFTFTEIPRVKELGTPDKIRRLVECILKDEGTVSDTYGHIAAMLEFLGFQKWIAENHIVGITFAQYDKWCTQNIMNKASGDSFKHYRLSVNVDSKDTSNASYKYNGWKYKDRVKEEYEKILNS